MQFAKPVSKLPRESKNDQHQNQFLPAAPGCAEGRALEAVGGSGRAAASPACRAEAQRRRKPSPAACRVAAGRRREGLRHPFRVPIMSQLCGFRHTRQRLGCGIRSTSQPSPNFAGSGARAGVWSARVFSAALVRAPSPWAASSCKSRGLGSLRHPDSKGSRQLAKFADPLFRLSDFLRISDLGPRILRSPLRPVLRPAHRSSAEAGGPAKGSRFAYPESVVLRISPYIPHSELRAPHSKRSALKESNLIQPNPTKK